jgi:hypothetical protein
MQTWLDGSLWRATIDHITELTPDLPEDLRELWETYETQFCITRMLVGHTSLSATHTPLVNTVARFAERVAARAAAASDDEPVSCGRNCGDCGNGPFGCGLTRGDFREPEEPHPLDGPQSFQAITASCTACGGTAEYSAGLLWVPAESFEVLKQVGMVARAIHDSISPWHRHIYSNLRWMARAPDPEKPGKSFDGLYLINTHVAGVGYKPHPVASDGEYSLGLVSHHNMQSWTFKVTTVVEGTPEYERYCSLTSVWAHLNIDIPHTPCVSDEDYAAYRVRRVEEYEAKERAAAAARYAKRVALYGTYEECPGGPEDWESRDRMAYHSDRVDREETY